jgi:hypothetical protein
MRTVFGPEGQIRDTDILAGLVSLWREGASGSLLFSRSGATAGFELASGEILGASSSDPRFDTAAILVRAGKLEASTLERLTAAEGADRAMTALQAGVLTKREWRWGEKIRAVEVLSDLLTWIEGDYTFFRAPSREAGEFRLTIPRLVLELFLRSRDRGLVLQHLGGVDVPLVRDSHFESEFATFGLTDDAESVVRLIDGESTAADIAGEAPAETFAVEKLLAALVTLGLVHPAYAVGESDSEREVLGPRPESWAAAAASPRPASPEEGEEALEPEVDIDEKVEATAAAPGAELEAEDRGGETPEDAVETEELADAPLETLAAAEQADDEAQRLASDFQTEPPGPGDLMAPETAGIESDSEFDRPLDLTTGTGSDERPRHRSSSSLLWLFLGLAALVGGILYWRARGPAGAPGPMAAAATPSPTPGEEKGAGLPVVETPPPAPSAAAAAAPTVREATAAPTRRAPAAVPTKLPPTAIPAPRAPAIAPTKRAPVSAGAKTAAPAARPESRQQWLDRAEHDEKRAASDRNARFAIQLELVCELPSLSEAWAHDRPAGTMWVVTTSFRGKNCFRVLWGRYPTREAAERALPGAPAFFSTPRNRPMAVPIR